MEIFEILVLAFAAIGLYLMAAIAYYIGQTSRGIHYIARKSDEFVDISYKSYIAQMSGQKAMRQLLIEQDNHWRKWQGVKKG